MFNSEAAHIRAIQQVCIAEQKVCTQVKLQSVIGKVSHESIVKVNPN